MDSISSIKCIAGGKLRIWSLGEDGQDYDGQGHWNPVRGKNIVFDVPR